MAPNILWKTKLSKKAKIGVVLSIVWLILLFGITLGNFSTGGYGGPNWGVFNIFFLFGVLPLVIAWGIRWIFLNDSPQIKKTTVKGAQQTNEEKWCEMGYEYIRKGELTAAEECYQEALKINPKNPYALLNLSYIYSQKEKSGGKGLSYYQRLCARVKNFLMPS